MSNIVTEIYKIIYVDEDESVICSHCEMDTPVEIIRVKKKVDIDFFAARGLEMNIEVTYNGVYSFDKDTRDVTVYLNWEFWEQNKKNTNEKKKKKEKTIATRRIVSI